MRETALPSPSILALEAWTVADHAVLEAIDEVESICPDMFAAWPPGRRAMFQHSLCHAVALNARLLAEWWERCHQPGTEEWRSVAEANDGMSG